MPPCPLVWGDSNKPWLLCRPPNRSKIPGQRYQRCRKLMNLMICPKDFKGPSSDYLTILADSCRSKRHFDPWTWPKTACYQRTFVLYLLVGNPWRPAESLGHKKSHRYPRSHPLANRQSRHWCRLPTGPSVIREIHIVITRLPPGVIRALCANVCFHDLSNM